MALPNLKCLISRENLHQVGSLIFLHGEKYTAESMKKYLKSLIHRELEFDHIRVIFPQAPDIPYRIPLVDGTQTGLWYEQISYSPTTAERKDSINYSCSLIRQFVNMEKSRGIAHDKIIIGGFDMGGTLAMHVGYRFLTDIAGVFALSSILSSKSIVFEKIRRDMILHKNKRFPPIWMWHGDVDPNRLRWAAHTAECFTDLEIETDFSVNFARQGHEIIAPELFYLKKWVETIVPDPEKSILKK
ncbi:lysophospholipase-like protein 1 [Montipora capricornis]|uniref:lysophospholipase-like protein 1 n=1 Tax=Montipora capricornis TaxID=246305 RepID=UPI0035F12304